MDSTVRAESDWAEESYTGSDGSVVNPRGGGSSSSGSTQPKFLTKYISCSAWHHSSGRLVFSYPAEDSSSYRCWFPDRSMSDNDTCPPRGDRASNGRVDYYIERVKDDGSKVWLFARFKCLYPTDDYAPIERLQGSGKVYTGGQAAFRNVGSYATASRAGTGGTLTASTGYITRNVNLGNPEAYTGSWQPSFTARTGTLGNGSPMYGYYRLQWDLDYRICDKWAYPSWLGQPARYDCSKAGRDTTVTGYTYACNINPALQARNVAGARFSPHECQQSWRCEFRGQLSVNGITSDLTVMRNGEELEIRNPTPSVTGQVRNARSWTVLNSIKSGSSPLKPKVDPNSSEQYFRASFQWDKRVTYRPTENLAFYWASDTAGSGFSWSQSYGFTGDFYVPKQDAVGGSTVWVWAADTTTCPQSITSPRITVVRAVSGP